jgi:hypothetical protein
VTHQALFSSDCGNLVELQGIPPVFWPEDDAAIVASLAEFVCIRAFLSPESLMKGTADPLAALPRPPGWSGMKAVCYAPVDKRRVQCPTNLGKAPKPTIFQQRHSGHVRRMSGHTNILLVPAEGVRRPSLSIQSQIVLTDQQVQIGHVRIGLPLFVLCKFARYCGFWINPKDALSDDAVDRLPQVNTNAVREVSSDGSTTRRFVSSGG